jgi:hypothetical protein
VAAPLLPMLHDRPPRVVTVPPAVLPVPTTVSVTFGWALRAPTSSPGSLGRRLSSSHAPSRASGSATIARRAAIVGSERPAWCPSERVYMTLSRTGTV